MSNERDAPLRCSGAAPDETNADPGMRTAIAYSSGRVGRRHTRRAIDQCLRMRRSLRAELVVANPDLEASHNSGNSAHWCVVETAH